MLTLSLQRVHMLHLACSGLCAKTPEQGQSTCAGGTDSGLETEPALVEKESQAPLAYPRLAQPLGACQVHQVDFGSDVLFI